ncbi:MAG TPA: hypothetical protein VND62_00480, partial [Acidimicrobiales bacterium]|nr:hypothetical protein [Acidimicrobiales bacterium]
PVGSDAAASNVIVRDPADNAEPVEGTGGELVAVMDAVGTVVAPAAVGYAVNPLANTVVAAQSAATTEARSSAWVHLLNGPSPPHP